jgi:hypothetical protein
MKKKKYYIILSKETRQNYGAFPRDKIGHEAAKKYKNQLTKENNIEFIIK